MSRLVKLVRKEGPVEVTVENAYMKELLNDMASGTLLVKDNELALDLFSRSSFPTHQDYGCNPEGTKELQGQEQELLAFA